jgi:hypothetical protein
VVHAYDSSYVEAEAGSFWSENSMGKNVRPYLKIKYSKNGWGCVAQVVEYLPNKP